MTALNTGTGYERAIRVVQVSFPQIYLACHTRHQRKRSTEHHLSPRDAAILAHLDEDNALTPATLARHLGIARSTISEALKRLAALGFVQNRATGGVLTAGRARMTAVCLSAKGARAIGDTSVLETQRLRAALAPLEPTDLKVIVAGMERLAAACRHLGEPSREERYP